MGMDAIDQLKAEINRGLDLFSFLHEGTPPDMLRF